MVYAEDYLQIKEIIIHLSMSPLWIFFHIPSTELFLVNVSYILF